MAPAGDSHGDVLAALERMPLVDHHVHGALRQAPSRADWGNAFIEADTEPAGPGVDPLDSQLGMAVRAWCAPLLDLPRHVEADSYWQRRSELGEDEVNRRFLTAAGVGRWLVDTGFGADRLLGPDELAAVSGAPAEEIVRLEVLAEELAGRQVSAAAYPQAFRELLASRTAHAVGTKTILAYRCGFAVDLSRPSDAAVVAAYGRWQQDRAGRSDAPRVVDPVLLAFGIHEAVAAGLPVQFHVGLGDRDMDLRDSDPLLLTDFLRDPATRGASILLLHCYPFERQAGYLAQAFAGVYFDVGLSVNYLGARSAALVARALELAPLHKLLYSSDAFGPAELHYLGARLWRNGLARTLQRFVDDGEWSLPDAVRVAERTASENAGRAYPRLAEHPLPPSRDHSTETA